MICYALAWAVQSDLSDNERQQRTLYQQDAITARVQQLPYQPVSALNLAIQQLIRPNQSKPQSSSSLSSSLASMSLHSPSIRIPSAIPSSVPRTHSSRASTPLSTQRQLKFHAASATSISAPSSAPSSTLFGGGGLGSGSGRGVVGGEQMVGGVVDVSPHVQPLLQLISTNKRDEVFRLLCSISNAVSTGSDEKDDRDE